MKQIHMVTSFKIQATLGIAVIALAVGLAPTTAQAQKKGGGIGGLVGGVVANYIYDALTGNKVPVTPPMDGKITAKPKVEAFGGFRKHETINGYASDGLEPEIEAERDKGYNDDKWTAYFDIDFGEVIDNPDYDPDAEPGELESSKYILPTAAEFNEHGDKFKSRGQMQREYSTAKQGYFFLDDGHRYIDFTKKGRWVYYGESELIKCYHRLKNKIKDTDSRLAKDQTYRAELWWRLDHLTWSKEEGDFKVARTDLTWRTEFHVLSATSPSSTIVEILPKKNTRVNTLTKKGRSQLYWASKEAHEPWVGYYTLWERKQHDELNSKSN